MNDELQRRLAFLGSLVQSDLSGTRAPCKICRSQAPFLDATDFQKCTSGHPFGLSGVEVRWYRCNECGFLFTPFFDNWTHRDFTRFVYNEDYGRVDPDYARHRPISIAELLAGRLRGHEDLRVLDYGSGTGLTAKRMAELGFSNVENYDPFSSPAAPAGKFDLITCFEVIEHSPDPVGIIADMTARLTERGGCIILGESLQPPDIGHLRAAWWYCAPRNGHCSTFTGETLSILARRFGLVFHDGGNIHCMRLGADARYRDIADRFGEALISATIGSPDKGNVDGWHAREGDFRWTAMSRLTWTVRLPNPDGGPANVRVHVPVVMEIRPGFAAECGVRIGGVSAAVTQRGVALYAEAAGVEFRDDLEIVLTTPPHCSPAELRGAPDSRPLGLAIRCGATPGNSPD